MEEEILKVHTDIGRLILHLKRDPAAPRLKPEIKARWIQALREQKNNQAANASAAVEDWSKADYAPLRFDPDHPFQPRAEGVEDPVRICWCATGVLGVLCAQDQKIPLVFQKEYPDYERGMGYGDREATILNRGEDGHHVAQGGQWPYWVFQDDTGNYWWEDMVSEYEIGSWSGGYRPLQHIAIVTAYQRGQDDNVYDPDPGGLNKTYLSIIDLNDRYRVSFPEIARVIEAFL